MIPMRASRLPEDNNPGAGIALGLTNRYIGRHSCRTQWQRGGCARSINNDACLKEEGMRRRKPDLLLILAVVVGVGIVITGYAQGMGSAPLLPPAQVSGK